MNESSGSRTVWRGDANYEATRRGMVWNQIIPDRFPEVIVTVASDADVVEAVRLARSRGLQIAVRSGGHSWIANSLRDGGMLIDLSRLSGTTIDAKQMTAAVQPATRNTQTIAQLAAHGLIFPAGHCPTVAMGGYMLAGGQGWNQGTWGPACQNLLALDYVDADGTIVRADAGHNADLFWAARGGGPGFPGVILRYHVRLFAAPRSIRQSISVYPLDALESLVPWLAETVATLSPSVEMLMLMSLPSPGVAAALPDPNQRYLVLWPVAFGASDDETTAALAPLEANPIRDRALVWNSATPVTWDELFAIEGFTFPEGHRYDTEVLWSASDPTTVLSGLRDRLARAPSLRTSILAAVTGPSPIDPAAPAMAYSMAAPLYIGCYSAWENAADDEDNRRWQQETLQWLRPYTYGHYMGETDLLDSPSRAAESLGPGVWDRLKAVKRKYDPEGLFHSHIGQT